MSDSHSHHPDGFFALRTPLLPLAEWLDWGQGLEAWRSGSSESGAAVQRDRERVRERLRVLLERPEVRDALWIASPDLEASLPYWLSAPEGERGQKVERALVRYLSRLCSRPTPFGLFAGCSMGLLGEETRLRLAGREAYRRHTRLDMDYLFALAEGLAREPELRAALPWRPGSSLYRAAGRLRYARAHLEGKARAYHLVAVEPSDYLLETLERARPGAKPGELAAALVSEDISAEEAAGFIDQLIEAQLLESDLPPRVTGEEPIHAMISLLRGLPPGGGAAARLEAARDVLAEIDAAGLGVPPSRYRDVARGLEGLPAPVELPRLFQVDMVKPAPGATLGRRVAAELWRGVEVLRRLVLPQDEELARFRDAFRSRYEGREVPLLEALDEESGIGFGNADERLAEGAPLLEGLRFPSPEPTVSVRPAVAGLLLRKVDEARRAGALELQLSPEELDTLLPGTPPRLPDSLSVMATLIGTPERLAEGDYSVALEGVAGPSGMRLLGRFCHADPELHRHVEAHLRAEEALRPGAVFAEIVHLPEGRIGNLLCRPVLRQQEIAFLGNSGAPRESQLPLADLRLRVEGERVVLRSARLGREVIPRLTSAHNYGLRSLGVYRFLCALQAQGVVERLGWRWGVLEQSPFLPRVRCGRVVLARARWRLDTRELQSLGTLAGAALVEGLRTLVERRGLPRHVALVDGDNVLPLDLENVLCAETFVQLVKGRELAVLRELLPGPEALAVQGPEGAFVHELVVPFLRNPPEPSPTVAPQSSSTSVPKPRSFAPGSAWLYAKLYTGTASADVLLREHLAPFIEEVKDSGATGRWFFLRYGDPDWHVRLRFLGEPARLLGEVLPELSSRVESLTREGLVRRLVLDTYEREVERYGGDEGVELAERLFHHDSEAVLALMPMLAGGEEGADARWRLALYGCHRLLVELGLELEARLRVVRQARALMAHEHRLDKTLGAQLSARYREERRSLEELLLAPAGHPLAQGFGVLEHRSRALAPVVSELKALEQRGHLRVPLELLAGSYMHMHVNRMLRAAHRAQELVLYDFLSRLYESQAARARRLP
ncbi:lantibiotic dehydratase [Archangium violaceum]|uniref:lantibiotic dehydratase n=1 Tax=Archangium violaceum TaxID=83451 RepID=UPI00193B2983|nr:lantibiotic dehydratase [Archangium violaceum]QRK11345.1 lantibiotic dehydratase [Archangium violaceum]